MWLLDPDAKYIVSSDCSDSQGLADYREYGFVAARAKPYSVTELSPVLDGVLNGEEG